MSTPIPAPPPSGAGWASAVDGIRWELAFGHLPARRALEKQIGALQQGPVAELDARSLVHLLGDEALRRLHGTPQGCPTRPNGTAESDGGECEGAPATPDDPSNVREDEIVIAWVDSKAWYFVGTGSEAVQRLRTREFAGAQKVVVGRYVPLDRLRVTKDVS